MLSLSKFWPRIVRHYVRGQHEFQIGNLAKHAGLIPHSELVENYKPELIPETDDWTDTSFTWLDFDNRLRALKENNSGLNQNLRLTPDEKAEHAMEFYQLLKSRNMPFKVTQFRDLRALLRDRGTEGQGDSTVS